MATSIRLKRVGAKKQASYRIVVIDSREGTSGASVERLGIYNPRTQPSVIKLNAARALHWLHEGAEPSHTVRSLFKKTGVWKQFHDGVTAEALEEAMILIGPASGAQGTSQRPMPTDRAPEPTVEEEPAKKAKTGEAPAEETEAAAAGAEEAPAAEAEQDVVVEPEPMREEEPEVADAKEGGEPVAEAVEAVDETADEEAEPVAEVAEEEAEGAGEEPAAEAAEEESEEAEEESGEEPVAEAADEDEADEDEQETGEDDKA